MNAGKLFATSLLITSSFLPLSSFAESPAAPAAPGGVDLNDDDFVRAALEAQKGQSVTLRLLSGEEISGKVSEVGEAAAKITELTGKEFFEAYVRTGDVAAVIVRTKK
jgi:hypothetical protein